jgi:hypothetical protein
MTVTDRYAQRVRVGLMPLRRAAACGLDNVRGPGPPLTRPGQGLDDRNPGTSHADAVRRCLPALRTMPRMGPLKALCERHNDTS